jgi:hypothetical protein
MRSISLHPCSQLQTLTKLGENLKVYLKVAMERFIGVEEARARLGRLVDEVGEGAEAIVLARRGRARAVLVSLDDYTSLKDEKAREARAELVGLLGEVRKEVRAAGLDRSVVDEAIAAARKLVPVRKAAPVRRPTDASPEDRTRLRISVDRVELERFCERWKITDLSFFGSVLTDAFGPDSDVDVLVSFEGGARWGLAIVDIEEELSRIVGRKVDLVTRDAVEESPNWIRRRSILEGSERFYARR